MAGYFITFEGGEGNGKTTQSRLLAKHLRAKGYEVVETREPGGTKGSEAIRHFLLSGKTEAIGPQIEAYLIAAARLAHLEEVIRPALKNGSVVICDRFIDSTRVYQGLNPQISQAWLEALLALVVSETMPNITFLLDCPVSIAIERAILRRGQENADRFEKEALSLHEARRQAFLCLAKKETKRFRIIDGGITPLEIAALIAQSCDEAMIKQEAKSCAKN
ncbi:dTMP kinase [Bartonella sp. DGB2]|uniref:dTMP kinase n=1 Tax=Bartonella sp. DGB2 TaxID=3388426 RepID=UPI0039901293